MSQEQQILNHLKSGRALTPIEALSKFGCFRLGARIHDLRNQGYPILTRTVKSKGKQFAEYYMGVK